MELFDTHAHLDDERFDEDRDQVIARMRENGVSRCLLIGADLPSSRAALTAFLVTALSWLLSCSTRSKVAISNHLRFVFQLVQQFIHAIDAYAGFAHWRGFDF